MLVLFYSDMQLRKMRFSWPSKNWSVAIKHCRQIISLEDNRCRLKSREGEAVEVILRDFVVQVPLPSDGDGLFK
jgi:hypothetical protein